MMTISLLVLLTFVVVLVNLWVIDKGKHFEFALQCLAPPPIWSTVLVLLMWLAWSVLH